VHRGLGEQTQDSCADVAAPGAHAARAAETVPAHAAHAERALEAAMAEALAVAVHPAPAGFVAVVGSVHVSSSRSWL